MTDKNESPLLVLSSLKNKGFDEYDWHHLFYLWLMQSMVEIINEQLTLSKEKTADQKNELLEKLLDKLKGKSKVTRGDLIIPLKEICGIDLTDKKKVNKAAHALFNMIFEKNKPQRIIEKLENIDDWILNEPVFRSRVAEFFICIYAEKFTKMENPPPLPEDKKIIAINSLLVNNRNNGANIHANELMHILMISKQKVIRFVREEFLPPDFDNEKQQTFWEIIPS